MKKFFFSLAAMAIIALASASEATAGQRYYGAGSFSWTGSNSGELLCSGGSGICAEVYGGRIHFSTWNCYDCSGGSWWPKEGAPNTDEEFVLEVNDVKSEAE